VLFRLAAAVIGVLLLLVGDGFWDSPPDPQVAKVGDADEVVTKETKATWNDKTEVTTEPG